MGALGLTKKGLEKIIGKFPGNINLKEVQKTALLGATHTLRNVQDGSCSSRFRWI